MKKTNLQPLFKKLTARVKKLEAAIADSGKWIKDLERQGCRYNASPLWKLQRTNKTGGQTKYLRISYGKSRPYEYIGKDPAKVKAALASISRGKKARELERRQRALQLELNGLESAVRDVIMEYC